MEQYADRLLAEPHMRQCLAMHLLLLWDFALLDGGAVDRCMQVFDSAAAGAAAGAGRPGGPAALKA